MNIINCGYGLLSCLKYLKKVEKYIDKVYYTEIKSYKEFQDLEKFQNEFLINIESRMKHAKNYTINLAIQREAYMKAMKGKNSARLRPLFFFIGNLCGKDMKNEFLVEGGLSLELIHKMSLIVDDYFDKDLIRRGSPTFHTIYDTEILIHISRLLMKISNNIFMESITFLNQEKQNKLIMLYKQIIMDMGKGFIEDLDRKERYIDIDETCRINDLQTTTMLKNSLLMGYAFSCEVLEDQNFYYLEQIGNFIGRIGQGLNDIENFLSEDNQLKSKGKLYSDLNENRKNLILSKVPKVLFYPPYTNDDVIEYIISSELVTSTMQELEEEIMLCENSCKDLSNSIGKDTLLFCSHQIVGNELKRIKHSKSNFIN